MKLSDYQYIMLNSRNSLLNCVINEFSLSHDLENPLQEHPLHIHGRILIFWSAKRRHWGQVCYLGQPGGIRSLVTHIQ